MFIDWDALLPAAPPAARASVAPQPAPTRAAIETTSKGAPPHGRDDDNRRRCTDCGNLNERGLCLAAYRGEIVASRSYNPIRDLLRRCEGFNPLPSDPDQRSARDRWGAIYGDTAAPAAPIIEPKGGKGAP